MPRPTYYRLSFDLEVQNDSMVDLKHARLKLIDNAMPQLTENEQLVIRQQFFKLKKLREIAKILNVTPQRVHAIGQSALAKLKLIVADNPE